MGAVLCIQNDFVLISGDALTSFLSKIDPEHAYMDLKSSQERRSKF